MNSTPAPVIVWQCEKCRAQKEPGAMQPHIPKHTEDAANWLFVNGGMVHRCAFRPAGEAEVRTQQFPDGRLLPVYGYQDCRMRVLLGEEAEEWELLRNSSSEERQD